VTEFYDWDDLRAELHDGDDEAFAAERARTEVWMSAFRFAEECTPWSGAAPPGRVDGSPTPIG